MEEFLIKCLDGIRKVTGWNRDKEVKKSIDDTEVVLRWKIDELNKTGKTSDNQAEKYLQPIFIALSSTNLDCREQALITLSQLIERGYLKGKAELSRDQPNITVMDDIIERICGCLENQFINDSIEVRVIRTLLTAVTSEECEIHENTLLNILYSIFDIYFNAMKQENKMLAYAALSQIVGYIFDHMNEVDKQYLSQIEPESLDFEPNIFSTSTAAELVSTLKSDFIPDVDLPSIYKPVLTYLGYKFSLDVLRRSQTGLEKDMITTNIKSNEEEMREIELLNKLPTVYHRDTYLFIRSLGILSLTPLNKDNAIEFRNISLSLLTNGIPKGKEGIRRIDVFIECIKQHLLKSLLFNFMSPNTEVYLI